MAGGRVIRLNVAAAATITASGTIAFREDMLKHTRLARLAGGGQTLYSGAMADPEAVADEMRRADALRRVVDVACALLRQARLPREEAQSVVAFVRARVLELFPGKEDVFELVLAPRFARILDEFCAPPQARFPALRRTLRRP
jgi:hypothetical protein